MADKYVDIHGFRVRFDNDSHTLHQAVHYLSDKIDKSEAKAFFDEAHREDNVHHAAHFQVHDHEKNKDHELTLVHEKDGSYHLRKRSINIIQ